MRSEIEDDYARPRELGEILDRRTGYDFTAERAEVGEQRVRQPLRAAANDGPAHGVTRDREQEPEGGRTPCVEREKRVRRVAGEEGARTHAGKLPRHARRPPQRLQAKACHQEGMSGRAEWRREHIFGQLGPCRHKRRVLSTPSRTAVAQAERGGIDRAFEEDGGAVVEGMCERGGRLHPLEPVGIEGKAAEERGRPREWVDCRAHVVGEAGQREAGRSETAAESPFGPEPTTTASCAMRKDSRSRSERRRRHGSRQGSDTSCVVWREPR